MSRSHPLGTITVQKHAHADPKILRAFWSFITPRRKTGCSFRFNGHFMSTGPASWAAPWFGCSRSTLRTAFRDAKATHATRRGRLDAGAAAAQKRLPVRANREIGCMVLLALRGRGDLGRTADAVAIARRARWRSVAARDAVDVHRAGTGAAHAPTARAAIAGPCAGGGAGTNFTGARRTCAAGTTSTALTCTAGVRASRARAPCIPAAAGCAAAAGSPAVRLAPARRACHRARRSAAACEEYGHRQGCDPDAFAKRHATQSTFESG